MVRHRDVNGHRVMVVGSGYLQEWHAREEPRERAPC
jgi:hypothetical protein